MQFNSLIEEYNYIVNTAEKTKGQSRDKWIVDMLTSIAHSLAVIGDKLSENDKTKEGAE